MPLHVDSPCSFKLSYFGCGTIASHVGQQCFLSYLVFWIQHELGTALAASVACSSSPSFPLFNFKPSLRFDFQWIFSSPLSTRRMREGRKRDRSILSSVCRMPLSETQPLQTSSASGWMLDALDRTPRWWWWGSERTVAGAVTGSMCGDGSVGRCTLHDGVADGPI